jgi:hypothetical protein
LLVKVKNLFVAHVLKFENGDLFYVIWKTVVCREPFCAYKIATAGFVKKKKHKK